MLALRNYYQKDSKPVFNVKFFFFSEAVSVILSEPVKSFTNGLTRRKISSFFSSETIQGVPHHIGLLLALNYDFQD